MTAHIKQVRGALIQAQELAKAHIVFVCVPVLGDDDHIQLGAMAQDRLDAIKSAARQYREGK